MKQELEKKLMKCKAKLVCKSPRLSRTDESNTQPLRSLSNDLAITPDYRAENQLFVNPDHVLSGINDACNERQGLNERQRVGRQTIQLNGEGVGPVFIQVNLSPCEHAPTIDWSSPSPITSSKYPRVPGKNLANDRWYLEGSTIWGFDCPLTPFPSEKINQSNKPPPVVVSHPPPTPISAPPPSEPVSKKDQKKLDKKEKKKGKKGGISKADISGPSNFQHLSHLGWDKNKNQFDEGAIDPALRELLASAGVTTNELKDESTAQFIQDFVDNYGGLDTLKEKQRRSTRSHGRPPPPAPPSANAGPPAGRQPPPQRGGPPPPPTRQSQPPPPQRGARTAPPPPSSGRAAPVAPRGPPAPAAPRAPAAPAAPNAPPAPRAPAAPAAPRAPAAPQAPGAPPAPRAPSGAPAPPLAAVAPGAPAPQSGRGTLLEEIQKGRALKSAAAPREDASPAAGGGGGDFLSQIRGFGGAGGALKSVESKSASPKAQGAARQASNPPPEDDGLEGMAGALARALAARKDATHDSESGSESDDDWSD